MIIKSEFQKQNFRTFGIMETANAEKTGKMRVSKDWQPTNNPLELRLKVRDIVWSKADEYRDKHDIKISDYNVIERCCRIPADTIKKAINGRYNITRNFLSKFCVGLKLEIEEANELFELQAGELNLTNDFDYIVFHALKTKDNIDYFLEEVYEYTEISLDRDRLK